jgi:hypothetical protein
VNQTGFRGAGSQRHATPAGCADRETSQQDRPRRRSWSHRLWAAGMKLPLYPFKHVRFDDDRNGNGHDFFVGLPLPSARGAPVKFQLTDVSCIGQGSMNRTNAEGLTPAGPVAIPVQPFDHLLDAECARSPVAVQVELVDQPYGLSFHRVDGEFLLDLGAAFFNFDQSVTKRAHGAVPESLAGVFFH